MQNTSVAIWVVNEEFSGDRLFNAGLVVSSGSRYNLVNRQDYLPKHLFLPHRVHIGLCYQKNKR